MPSETLCPLGCGRNSLQYSAVLPLAGGSFLKGMVEMSRYFIWMVLCLGCGAAVAAAPEQQAGAGPVCLYDSKSYSEGAYVCAQKSLMLTCSSDGTRAIWKPVGDRDINERCMAPTTLRRPTMTTTRTSRKRQRYEREHPGL